MREPRLRNVRGVGIAACWAICVTVVAELGLTVGAWQITLAGESVLTGTELSAGDVVLLAAVVMWALGSLAAAVLFIVWLLRARENSEFLCDGKHSYARAWGGVGWFVPVAALWVPGRFVQQVAAASDPRIGARDAWIQNVKDSTVSVWWGFWIISFVANFLSVRVSGGSGDVLGVGALLLLTISTVTGGLAGVFAVLVIRMINRRQSARNPVPWWHAPA